MLLEVGFATILYAPWALWPLPQPLKRQPAAPAAWPLRFVLAKLMFMSGVVKVQALCPTWLRLTGE